MNYLDLSVASRSNFPVFWGSLVGLAFGSILAGLNYLELIGDANTGVRPNPNLVILCVVFCIRYYCSIIFLNYDPLGSPKVLELEPRARWTVFYIQLILILSCSLNVALLSIFGGLVAASILILQATLLIPYWLHLWRVYFVGDAAQTNTRALIAYADFINLAAAAYFFICEAGFLGYGTEAGAVVWVVIVLFLAEVVTNYKVGIKRLLSATYYSQRAVSNLELQFMTIEFSKNVLVTVRSEDGINETSVYREVVDDST